MTLAYDAEFEAGSPTDEALARRPGTLTAIVAVAAGLVGFAAFHSAEVREIVGGLLAVAGTWGAVMLVLRSFTAPQAAD